MHRLLHFIALSLLLTAIQGQAFSQVSFGRAENISEGWKFTEKDIVAASSQYFDDSSWADVDLPHDWSVCHEASDAFPSCMGYLPCGIGTYRKNLDIPEQASGRKFYIYFEGVYNRSTVWINGHCLGSRPNGYVSFMYDLTPYLDFGGKNVLTVRVDHSRGADSRWYTGSGIYRNVWLVESSEIHIAQWGVYAVPVMEKNGKWRLDVETEVENGSDSEAEVIVYNRLKSPSGKIVAKSKNKVAVGAGVSDKVAAGLKVNRPELWSIDNPALYSLETVVVKDRRTIDSTVTMTGFREFRFSADSGFFLNGKNMKMKGVCLHHDAGVLGAAVPEVVWKERLKALKELGCNAIRTTHNPHAPYLYDLCDELGLLVLDEAFDEWEFPKRKWIDGWNVGTPLFEGSYDFFEEWSDRDIADMVRRDRNHVSVFAWSIGNEVDYPNDPYSHPSLDGGDAGFTQPVFGGYKPEAPDAMRLGAIASRLAGVVRKYDLSRPVTAGLAGVVMSNETEYPSALDITGYNYTESRYVTDHQKYPERVIFGSENRHDFLAWKSVTDNDHIFGQFLWTGIDYLGESTPWPARGFGSGLLDFASYVKPLGYFRKALWSDEPFVHISTYREPCTYENSWDVWNYSPGDTVNVVCFTNCHSAELELNGEPAGEGKSPDGGTGLIVWKVPYSAGVLEVNGFDGQGRHTAGHSLRTAGCPARLDVAVSEKDAAGGIYIIDVRILDKDGYQVNDAGNEIACSIDGPAVILGMESGSNTDMSLFDGSHRKAFRGRLKAYVKRTGPGSISASFSAEGMEDGIVALPDSETDIVYSR